MFYPSTTLAPTENGMGRGGRKSLIVLVGRTGIEPVAR